MKIEILDCVVIYPQTPNDARSYPNKAHTYTVTVNAVGIGELKVTKQIPVEIFADLEARIKAEVLLMVEKAHGTTDYVEALEAVLMHKGLQS